MLDVCWIKIPFGFDILFLGLATLGTVLIASQYRIKTGFDNGTNPSIALVILPIIGKSSGSTTKLEGIYKC